VPRWTALLLFPLIPTIAARRLQGAWHAAIVPVAVCAAVSGYLASHGVAGADALWSGASLLRVLLGMFVGGLVAAWIGARVVGRAASLRELAGPSLAAAGWAPCVFLLVVGIGHAASAGVAAGVYAGIALLIWGIAAGLGIIAGEEECEPGRLLVASCFGLGGVLIGLWVALAAPPAPWVQAVPAPVTEAPFTAGDLLLVRTEKSAESAGLFLLRKPDSREAVVVRRDGNGSLTPFGAIQVGSEMLQDWNNAGRVFFQYGTGGGETVDPGKQTPKPSQD
jgi:hypothetical protein